MSETKVVGLKRAVNDIKWAPKGYHCEIWAKRIDADTVEVWTSEYLTANSWTTGPTGWTQIDRYVREYKDMGYSWTKSIRMAATEEVD